MLEDIGTLPVESFLLTKEQQFELNIACTLEDIGALPCVCVTA